MEALVWLFSTCKIGGLVTQQYNEVRDALGDIAALAFKVTREPVVRKADEASGISALIEELGVRVYGSHS